MIYRKARKFTKSQIYMILYDEISVCNSHTFPKHLYEEYDYERNEDHLNEYTHGSNRKRWWVCRKNVNHSWKVSIANRYNGRGCPYCSCGCSKVTMEESFGSLFTELLKDWNYEKNKGINPYCIRKGSNKKVHWKCKKNSKHLWQTTIVNRSHKNVGCPYCSKGGMNPKVLREESFAALRQDLLSSWDWNKNIGIDPYTLRIGSGKKVFWRCSKSPSHSWSSRIYFTCFKNTDCPYCAGIVLREESFPMKRPDIFRDWDWSKNIGIDPYTLRTGSHRSVFWRCSENPLHLWRTNIKNRCLQNTGCPKCFQISSMSKGESKISEILNTLNISYVTEHKFPNCKNILPLPFDFYFQHKLRSLVLEFDGRQHFRSVKYFGGTQGFRQRLINDRIKNNFCVNNKIHLLRIAYTDFDSIFFTIEGLINEFSKQTEKYIMYSNPELYEKTNNINPDELVEETESIEQIIPDLSKLTINFPQQVKAKRKLRIRFT